eukprot:scaffold234359_cov33-Tisochrysis_lutea.AAC.1
MEMCAHPSASQRRFLMSTIEAWACDLQKRADVSPRSAKLGIRSHPSASQRLLTTLTIQHSQPSGGKP